MNFEYEKEKQGNTTLKHLLYFAIKKWDVFNCRIQRMQSKWQWILDKEFWAYFLQNNPVAWSHDNGF